mmetsp:Transcript_160775/g.516012  ORF Transcript_160775/g.516012 Transcript_160775/m.516012 type:complete len:271 (-) Transcript_160775:1013-1825(-)
MPSLNLAAASILKFSRVTNALYNTTCSALSAASSACRRLAPKKPRTLASSASSPRMASPISALSAPSPAASAAVRSARATTATLTWLTSSVTDFALALMFSTAIAPSLSSAVSCSNACTLGRKPSNSTSSPRAASLSSAFRLSTSARLRSAASSASFCFCRPTTASRAMPTADLSNCRSSNSTPAQPPLTKCLRIRSRSTSGKSKPYSPCAYARISPRHKKPSASVSYRCIATLCFSARLGPANLRRTLSLLSSADFIALSACLVACCIL